MEKKNDKKTLEEKRSKFETDKGFCLKFKQEKFKTEYQIVLNHG